MSQEASKIENKPPKKLKTTQTKAGRPSGWVLAAALVLAVAALGGWAFFIVSRLTDKPVEETRPTLTATTHSEPRATPALGVAVTPAPAGPTPTASLPTLAYGVVTSRVLNLRDQPTTASATTSNLKTGDIVSLARRDGGWYETTGGQWISATYLEVRQTRDEAESYAREIKKGL